MAQHKASSWRSVVAAVVLTAIGSLFLVLIGPAPADAELFPPVAPGKSVTPKDSHVTGKCNLTVQSVNPSNNSALIRLAAQAKPTNLSGYGTNVYTQIFCSVYDADSNLLASYNPFSNSATVPNSATQSSVPFSSQYFVCGRAFVKLNNGTQFFTPTVCA